MYIKNNPIIFKYFTRVAIFGSILRNERKCKDIDILLLYTTYSNEISRAICIISNQLEVMTNLPVDITALSEDEEKENRFLGKLKNIYKIVK